MTDKSVITIGTRGSNLALWQAKMVQKRIKSISPSTQVQLSIIKTTGDKNQKDTIESLGSKTVFVKEIESALLNKQIDIAVHSLKDMSSVPPEELINGAYIGGAPRNDLFISKKYPTLEFSPTKIQIGTGSPRRTSQIQQHKYGVKCSPIRGNIETRLAKLNNNEYDAIILAHAGVHRLKIDLSSYQVQVLEFDKMVPAPGQGIIAVQCRKEQSEVLNLLKSISDKEASIRGEVEFTLLKRLQIGCSFPLGFILEKKYGQHAYWFYYKDEQSGKSLYLHQVIDKLDSTIIIEHILSQLKKENLNI